MFNSKPTFTILENMQTIKTFSKLRNIKYFFHELISEIIYQTSLTFLFILFFFLRNNKTNTKRNFNI